MVVWCQEGFIFGRGEMRAFFHIEPGRGSSPLHLMAFPDRRRRTATMKDSCIAVWV